MTFPVMHALYFLNGLYKVVNNDALLYSIYYLGDWRIASLRSDSALLM